MLCTKREKINEFSNSCPPKRVKVIYFLNKNYYYYMYIFNFLKMDIIHPIRPSVRPSEHQLQMMTTENSNTL